MSLTALASKLRPTRESTSSRKLRLMRLSIGLESSMLSTLYLELTFSSPLPRHKAQTLMNARNNRITAHAYACQMPTAKLLKLSRYSSHLSVPTRARCVPPDDQSDRQAHTEHVYECLHDE